MMFPIFHGSSLAARKGCAMTAAANVVVLVGSLRKESLNRKIANALIALNAAPLKLGFAEFGHLPLYNQDIDGDNPPRDWFAFGKQIKSAAPFLFVPLDSTGSVPAFLKTGWKAARAPSEKVRGTANPAR